MTHGKPCVKMHVFTRQMESHVSTFMDVKLCINRCVHRRMRERQERKREREERRERERRKEIEKRNKGKEKKKKERKRKEADGFFLSSLASRWLELVRPTSKFRRFDERIHFKR